MHPEVHNEKDFILVDRTFQAGDICKRAVEDVQSGVVTNVKVEGRLEHAISGEPVPGWAVTEELVVPVVADIGDYVLCDDWVGQARIVKFKFSGLADALLGDRGTIPFCNQVLKLTRW
jgi:hypothetical protein